MEKGQAELEYYLTFSTPDQSHFEGNTTTQHQLELEIGHTARLDFAIYQVFEDKSGESLDYKGSNSERGTGSAKRGGSFSTRCFTSNMRESQTSQNTALSSSSS